MMKLFYMILFVAFCCNAFSQSTATKVPSEITYKKVCVKLDATELSIDSVFINGLVQSLYNDFRFPTWMEAHFRVSFEPQDSILYNIHLYDDGYPPENGEKYIGFAKKNEMFFWFTKTTPSRIVVKQNNKENFEYTRTDMYVNGRLYDDPGTWNFRYNFKTNIITPKY